MGGAGIITFAALLLLLPFQLAWHYFGKIRRLDPLTAARMKASHGAGMLALGAWALAMHDQIGVSGSLLWIPLVLGGFGLLWLGGGWRMAKILGPEPDDDFQTVRAIVKVGVGIGIFWLLGAGWRVLDRELWLLLVQLQWPVRAVAIWCIITGCAKFALLMAVKPRAPQPPPVSAKPPHGDARYASPDVARRMQQGHGGRESRVDQMRF
jgi:hypothetical protein